MHADAVVIGAGIIGCAVAFELARGGREVVVVDALAAAGGGSTGASSAIIRFHYSGRDSVTAAWESYHWWTRWEDYLGAEDGRGNARFIRTGGLVLDAPGTDSSPVLKLLGEVGVPCEKLTADEIRVRFPAIDPAGYGPPAPIDDDRFWRPAEGELRGYFTPDAGYIDDPQLAAHNLMAAARLHGARFLFRERVTAVTRKDDRVGGVVLASGRSIDAQVVVNVAGPASDPINRLAGVTGDMRVRSRPLRVETHTIPAPRDFAIDGGGVFVTDHDLGSAFRPQAGGLVHISSIEPECDPLEWVDDPESFGSEPSMAVYERQVYRVARRLPELAVPARPNGLGALYDVTPDWTSIFDRSLLPGFYLACGTSGNGFKLAPVAGHLMATLINACETGHDHDRDPVQVNCRATGNSIDLAAFSRLRTLDHDHPNNVLG
ncbi:FAD-dependent oxidoreductase [Actinomadura sp. B10D3]|uniref:NAD(P)/FAD-dependent oxidoreductase n=1 Tax=Actinomadura sp. B10D3 TaxID=3153557 RepID=UPI00325C718A